MFELSKASRIKNFGTRFFMHLKTYLHTQSCTSLFYAPHNCCLCMGVPHCITHFAPTYINLMPRYNKHHVTPVCHTGF